MTSREDDVKDARRAYFADIKDHPVLGREEERLLFERYLAGDRRAGNRLVECNLRLVAKIAGKFGRSRTSLLDLVQEGNIGLMHALRKFNPGFGTKFSTYASYWIRAYMLRHILRTWSLVKVATTQEQRKAFFRVPEAQRALAARTGDGHDAEAVAAMLGITPATAATLMTRLLGDSSLDAPREDREGRATNALDFLADETPPADERLDEARGNAAATSVVRDALTALDARERFIIENRAMSEEPLTLAEIGQRLGCTRERVRQLQVRAYEKMRQRIVTRRPS